MQKQFLKWKDLNADKTREDILGKVRIKILIKKKKSFIKNSFFLNIYFNKFKKYFLYITFVGCRNLL